MSKHRDGNELQAEWGGYVLLLAGTKYYLGSNGQEFSREYRISKRDASALQAC